MPQINTAADQWLNIIANNLQQIPNTLNPQLLTATEQWLKIIADLLAAGGSGVGSLEQTLTVGNDAANIPIYNLNGLQFAGEGIYDYEYSNAIDINNRILNDTHENNSILWNDRQLSDTYNNIAIDWQNRVLLDNNSSLSIDWQNGIIQNTDGTQSIDYFNHILYDAVSRISIDYDNRLLIDSIGHTKIDFENSQLYSSNGGNVVSLDFNTYSLWATPTLKALDWRHFILFNQKGNQNIDFGGRIVSGNIVSQFNIANCPKYANDGAAGAAGLIAGDVYQDNSGHLTLKQ